MALQSSSLSARTLGTVAGSLALALVIGVGVYLQFFSLRAPKVDPVVTKYPTDQVLREFGSQGIFQRLGSLVPVASSTDSAVTAQPGDLGKTDIGQYGK